MLADLQRACPTLALATDPGALDVEGVDALRPFRGRPDFASVRARPVAVASPADTGEVATLVRWAAEHAVPLVPRGGGSGLMGGAAVVRPAIVVDLHRMDAIVVDADACLVRTGAGAVLARVGEALAPHGLLLGHDPWTVGVATVGGVVGTNGLGYLGARVGSVAAQVRAVEAVLGDGRIVRTRPSPARSAGLDLGKLLVGTEGTLGIVTEVTLAVIPRPEEHIVQSWELPSFEAGAVVATRMRRTGIRPACLELDAHGTDDPSASLLLVFDGLRGEAAIHADRAAALLAGVEGTMRTAADAAAEWDARHAIAERWAASRAFQEGDWLPGGARAEFDYAHVGVPLAALQTVRGVAHRLVGEHGLTLVEEGLWHWPELYSVVVSGAPGTAAGVRATIDGVCRAAQDAGGTMEYCHGVGWQLAHLMEREHGVAGVDTMRRVKSVLDPRGIMNPGKWNL